MDPDRRVLKDGALAITGNKITWLGSAGEARQRFEASRTIACEWADTAARARRHALSHRPTAAARQDQRARPAASPEAADLAELPDPLRVRAQRGRHVSLQRRSPTPTCCGMGRHVSPMPVDPIPTRWPALRCVSGSGVWSPSPRWMSAMDFPASMKLQHPGRDRPQSVAHKELGSLCDRATRRCLVVAPPTPCLQPRAVGDLPRSRRRVWLTGAHSSCRRYLRGGLRRRALGKAPD